MNKLLNVRFIVMCGFIGTIGIMLVSTTGLAWQPVLNRAKEQEITKLRMEQAKNDLIEAEQKETYRGAQLKMLEAQAKADEIRAKNEELDKKVEATKEGTDRTPVESPKAE